MRKSLRTLAAVASFGIGSLMLTACDPPYPPEFLAQLAEQTYTCEAGDVTVFSEISLEPAITALSEALAGACIDPLPVMTMSPAASATDADLVVTSDNLNEGTHFLKVPFGFDAAVVTYNVPGADSIAVSYETLSRIFSGEITSWNDPVLAKENPDFELPELPISFAAQADFSAVDAMSNLLKNNGQNLDSANFESVAHSEFVAGDLAEGQLALVTNSAAVTLGQARLNFLPGGKDENGDRKVSSPTEEGLTSAGTQVIAKKSDLALDVSLDPKVEAKSLFEGEAVATPYQALIPVYLYLNGEDNLLKRALAAFLLRLDSQGSLGYANFSQLPEQVRVEAMALARKGLPVPKVKNK